MTPLLLRLSAFAFLLGIAQAQTAAPPAPDPAPEAVEADPVEDHVRVAVLGYHEFSKTSPATAMRIPTDTFRKQMLAIKDLGLPVISLERFLHWKRGDGELPPRCVLITIDDGWKSTYTEAFPILKELNFPFTVYLYKNYVDGGGRALTTKMIKEMQQHGGTIGSHSVSHPFPGTVKKRAKQGLEVYQKFLRTEFIDSKNFLEEKFDQPVTTYAYPGGYFEKTMSPIAHEAGYEFLFTVQPGKVRRTSPNQTLPRYIILGNHDQIFRIATTFRDPSGRAVVQGAIVQNTPHPVKPQPGSMVESRLPTVMADLSGVENLVPESVIMRVGGFGKVPARFDLKTKTVTWKINRRLRQPTCDVSVQWRVADNKRHEAPMSWTFLIDREAIYQIGGGQ
jgi:peptidoglycan/xylan/chitin deacetylase (PgdA/CDA1 family)